MLPDVPHPGHDVLIHERVADERTGARGLAEAPQHLAEIAVVGEEVRAKEGERWVDGEGTRFEKFEHWGVEVHDHGVRRLQDEPHGAARPAPSLSRPVDVPGPVQAKVSAKAEAVREVDEEVFPDGFDSDHDLTFDAVQPRERARPSRFGAFDDSSHEDVGKTTGETGEGIAFRHGTAPLPGGRGTRDRGSQA